MKYEKNAVEWWVCSVSFLGWIFHLLSDLSEILTPYVKCNSKMKLLLWFFRNFRYFGSYIGKIFWLYFTILVVFLVIGFFLASLVVFSVRGHPGELFKTKKMVLAFFQFLACTAPLTNDRRYTGKWHGAKSAVG